MNLKFKVCMAMRRNRNMVPELVFKATDLKPAAVGSSNVTRSNIYFLV